MRQTVPPTAAASPPREFYVGVLCVLLSAIGFSGKAIFVKLAYPAGIDALTLLALRMLFAFPLFVLLAWQSNRGGSVRLTRREWAAILILGAIGYYLSSYLDFLGLRYISAGLERLILFLNPTLVVAFSAVLFRQAVTPRHFVSLFLSYAGIALVAHEHMTSGEPAGRLFYGAALVFAAAVTYALYLVASGKLIARIGSMRFAAYASLAACVFVFGHFLLTRTVGDLMVAARIYGLVAMLAVFSTVLPIWLMAEGIHRIGAGRAAMISSVGPVVTIFLAYVFLNEPITALQLWGAGFVLLGIALITRKSKMPVLDPE